MRKKIDNNNNKSLMLTTFSKDTEQLQRKGEYLKMYFLCK